MSVKPSTPRPKKRRWICLRWCVRLPLLLLGGLLLLALLGVPGHWLNWLGGPVVYREVQMDAGELRYRPGAGLEIRDLRMYGPQDLVTPLFEADVLYVKPAWRAWLDERKLKGEVRLDGGRFETNLGMWTRDLRTDQLLRIDRLEGRMFYDGEGLVVQRLIGSLPNIDLALSGKFQTATLRSSGSGGEGDGLARGARQLAHALGFLENFQFETAPLLRLELKPDARFDLKMDLSHRGPGTHRGFAFEEILLEARYREGQLDLSAFRIRENEARLLSGAGEIDFREEQYTLVLENTLRRFGLEALSPFGLGKLLDRLQLRIEDRCDFELVLGPNRFAEPGNRINGRLYVENGFYRDAFFPELSLNLDLDMPQLNLLHLKGVVGQGKGQGPFQGDVRYNFDTDAVSLDIGGAFYPDKAISLVGATAERQLREWEFRGPAPVFSAVFRQAGKGAPMFLDVNAEGRQLLWRGTAFDKVASRVRFEDGMLRIEQAQALRGTEYFAGDLRFSPGFKGCDFSLRSHFHLPDLLQLMGQGVLRHAQPFRFRGPCVVEASGFMDLSGKHQHDFSGRFSFEDMVYQWLSLNTLSGRLSVTEEKLEIPDLQAEVEGGSLKAAFQGLQPFTDAGRFELSLALENMDLHKVITKATDLPDTPYRGRLSLDLALSGLLKDREGAPRSDSYQGQGRIEIREGALFRIPLLLGLSELLSKIVSGFGYASQSDFSADFVIGDGKISSEELFLQGNVLSIAGPGSYRFAGRKISANLKIHLLKEGILSDALKVILWPIRKLIEVQLTGTLENPDWQPKNLPKEIFGK